MAEWVAVVVSTETVEAKIRAKHAITLDEIREAVLLGAHDEQRWHDHPVYGRRLLVRGRSYDGRPLLVVLKRAAGADDVWECQTAIPWERS